MEDDYKKRDASSQEDVASSPPPQSPPSTSGPDSSVGISAMSGRGEGEKPPLPRPDNPETQEISKTPEATPGRDDGTVPATPVPPPSTPPTNDPTQSNISEDSRRRIKEMQESPDSMPPVAETLNPPVLTNETGNLSETVGLNSQPANLTPTGISAMQGRFRTDYPLEDNGGAAAQINAENADINKANRELREAHQWAVKLKEETGLTPEEYLKLKSQQSSSLSETDAQELSHTPAATPTGKQTSTVTDKSSFTSPQTDTLNVPIATTSPLSPPISSSPPPSVTYVADPATPIVPGTFSTNHSVNDYGGSASRLDAENSDINKANYEQYVRHQWADDLMARTGLTPDEYIKLSSEGKINGAMLEAPEPQKDSSPVVIAPRNIDQTSINLPASPPSSGDPLPADPAGQFASQQFGDDKRIHDLPQKLVLLPDGREAIVTGDPEEKKQFTHPQGMNDRGFQGTCGLVSCEDVARQAGVNVTENSVVEKSVNNEPPLCTTAEDVSDPKFQGGTTLQQRADLLTKIGIPNDIVSSDSIYELAQYVENGQGVIADVNPGILWDQTRYLRSGHAITVTGVARDPESKGIMGFFINDSGSGEAGKFIPANTFEFAWRARGNSLNVTRPSR